MKTNKGVTIIALIITIIIMLILLGTVVTLALGENGIIERTKRVTLEYEKQQLKEELSIALVNIETYIVQDDINEDVYYYETKEKFVLYGQLNTVDRDIKNYLVLNENKEILITIKFNKTNREYSFKIDMEKLTIEDANIEDAYGYSIEYILDGGINPEEAVTHYKEGEIVIFPNPTKENYIFEGWYQTIDFTGNKMIRTELNTKENLKLYAKWVVATSEQYFEWSTSGTNATITGLSATGLDAYKEGNLNEIIFPKIYNETYTVTTIKASAFSKKINIEKIYIPANINSIGKNAFYNCGQTAGELKVTLEPGRTTLSNAFFARSKLFKNNSNTRRSNSVTGKELL